jgi:hypothetical protein
MVAIYIHHLFFARPQSDLGDTGILPSVVWMIEEGRCSGFLKSPILGEKRRSMIHNDLSDAVQVRLGDFSAVQERMAKIYLWLICRDFVRDDGWVAILPGEAGMRAFTDLKQYLSVLRSALEKLVGLKDHELDYPEEILLGKVKNDLRVTGAGELDTVLRRLVGDRLVLGSR